jgi:hypothetical protein
VCVEFYIEEALGAMLMAKEVDKLYVSLKPPPGLNAQGWRFVVDNVSLLWN